MKANDLGKVRATLWTAADKRRANSSQSDGPIDVNKIADDVVARIHADPLFAAHVASHLEATEVDDHSR